MISKAKQFLLFCYQEPFTSVNINGFEPDETVTDYYGFMAYFNLEQALQFEIDAGSRQDENRINRCILAHCVADSTGFRCGYLPFFGMTFNRNPEHTRIRCTDCGHQTHYLCVYYLFCVRCVTVTAQ